MYFINLFYLIQFRFVRKLLKGRYLKVGPKYANYECWIRNEEPYSWEYVWEKEIYL